MTTLSKATARRNTRQRKRILEKSATLFYQKGYHSTSIRDIARECGFEPANLYHYFRSKEQVLYEVFREAADRTVSAIASLEHDSTMNAPQRLRALIRRHFSTPTAGGKPYYLLFDVELRSLAPAHRENIIAIRDTYDRVLRRIIEDGISEGTFSTTDVKLSGYAIASMIVRSRLWYTPKGRLSAEQVSDFMCEFALKAVGNSQATTLSSTDDDSQ